MSAETNQEVKVECIFCDKTFQIVVREPDYLDWKKSEKTAEECFPYLNKDQQDLLDGNICGPCTEKMNRKDIVPEIADEEISDDEVEELYEEDE